MTAYFQFRYKNFRRPSGRRFYKMIGTEAQILTKVSKMETNKTHWQYLYKPPIEIKRVAELININ